MATNVNWNHSASISTAVLSDANLMLDYIAQTQRYTSLRLVITQVGRMLLTKPEGMVKSNISILPMLRVICIHSA